jgi:RimJ/RimL family protein N-acetyltransferase
MTVVLRPISPAAGEALGAERAPEDVRVAPDHPTEFSAAVGRRVGKGSPLGPYFLHRAEDDVVVGEIGGGFTEPGLVEIGYAIVPSCWGCGYATAAVRALVARARGLPEVERMAAHTPLDRPASGRVLEKAGFTCVGEFDHDHDGVPMRVKRWELAVG